MKRSLPLFMLIAIGAPLMAQTTADSDQPQFQPAEIVSSHEVAIYTTCTAFGTVVLDALITQEGKPQEVEVRRDIPCRTAQAVDAVQDWKFSPAMVKGKAVASRIMVAVTFCPAGSMEDPISVGTLKSQTDAAIQAEFQPAEVLHGKYPLYPMDATAFGTVVLEASLTAKAEIGDMKVVQDLPPFTAHARETVGEWRFMAATDNGNPVPSRIVLAFVFPSKTVTDN
jgi:hypothetical protein